MWLYTLVIVAVVLTFQIATLVRVRHVVEFHLARLLIELLRWLMHEPSPLATLNVLTFSHLAVTLAFVSRMSAPAGQPGPRPHDALAISLSGGMTIAVWTACVVVLRISGWDEWSHR